MPLTPPPPPPAGSSQLSQELGFLLQQAHRVLLAAAASALDGTDCSVRAYHVLTVAREAGLNQVEIGKMMCIDRSVMVRVVDELEKLGLIARVPAPQDRRARILTLTDAGLLRLKEMRQAIRAAEDRLLQGLDAAARRGLTEALTYMASQTHDSCDACVGQGRAEGG